VAKGVDMKTWEFIDTVYSEAEARNIKTNMEKSGFVVKVEFTKTPSEVPCWRIFKKGKQGSL
jgi:hypothetical protein